MRAATLLNLIYLYKKASSLEWLSAPLLIFWLSLLLPQPRSTEPYFFSHLVLGLGLIPIALVLYLETGIYSKAFKRLASALKNKENRTALGIGSFLRFGLHLSFAWLRTLLGISPKLFYRFMPFSRELEMKEEKTPTATCLLRARPGVELTA